MGRIDSIFLEFRRRLVRSPTSFHGPLAAIEARLVCCASFSRRVCPVPLIFEQPFLFCKFFALLKRNIITKMLLYTHNIYLK